MKHAQIFFGLALATACLAVGSVGWVFGQPDAIVNVPPPPAPVAQVPQGQPPQVQLPQGPPALPGADGAVPPAQQALAQGLMLQLPVSPPAQPTGQSVAPVPQQPVAFPSQPILLENQLPAAARKPMDVVPPPAGNAVHTEAPPAGEPPARQELGVSVECVGPTTARLGQPTPYQIITRNTNSTTAQNVVVRFRIPPGVQVLGSDPRAVSDGGVLAWDLGNLAPTQERRIDLQVLPESRTPFSCQAQATFTGVSTLTWSIVRGPGTVRNVR